MRFATLLPAPLLVFLSFAMSACNESSANAPKPDASPAVIPANAETLVLGGGCFWCVEAAYEMVPGVLDAVSGYAGGKRPNPTYDQVSAGASGNAEVVKLTFDPARVTRADLLDFVWEIHDPTTLNRQGADVGTQYRSVIYYANDAEKALVLASRDKANPAWGGKIVTEITALPEFYVAEDDHQDYYRKNPNAGYCRVVIKPKLDKLTKHPLVKP
jgi:peptide-methionine (S)-S-oxide reductase